MKVFSYVALSEYTCIFKLDRYLNFGKRDFPLMKSLFSYQIVLTSPSPSLFGLPPPLLTYRTIIFSLNGLQKTKPPHPPIQKSDISSGWSLIKFLSVGSSTLISLYKYLLLVTMASPICTLKLKAIYFLTPLVKGWFCKKENSI